MSYKPDGHNSVSPYLIVPDAAKTLDFLEAAFGATRLLVVPGEGGRIAHAETRIDDSVVMMGEMPDAVPAHVHVYVRDVDAAFAKAEAAGGVVVQRPETKDDGDRRGGISDPNGVTWWIATH